jgi:hypothetical protein
MAVLLRAFAGRELGRKPGDADMWATKQPELVG